jgi:signal transduction histidine kinase
MADPAPSRNESKHVVLIVDDEVSLAQVIGATLGGQGLDTVLAYDGNRALELARTLKPDLILLDVMLPGQSGFEVCANLKRDPATASIPIIILTAKAELSARMTGIAAGADEYLTKPFSPIQLIDLVRKALSGRLAEYDSQWPDPSTVPADQWVIFAKELTELFKQEKAARQELEQAVHRLDRLGQLQTEFLGVITHELLTPFGAIGLALEVLQMQSKDLSADFRSTADDLATEIADLHRMINGVVKFAELMYKRRDPVLAYHNLDEIISEAVQPVAVLAQAREVDFRYLIAPGVPSVFADAGLLGEAVYQMAHNAVKFNKPGGQAQVRAFESDGWLTIEARDTGIGLTRDRLKLLGQPFEQHADTLRRGREGLGVGWAFVGYVAHVHYGRTYVSSPGPDKGSTFGITLPIVPEP